MQKHTKRRKPRASLPPPTCVKVSRTVIADAPPPSSRPLEPWSCEPLRRLHSRPTPQAINAPVETLLKLRVTAAGNTGAPPAETRGAGSPPLQPPGLAGADVLTSPEPPGPSQPGSSHSPPAGNRSLRSPGMLRAPRCAPGVTHPHARPDSPRAPGSRRQNVK